MVEIVGTPGDKVPGLISLEKEIIHGEEFMKYFFSQLVLDFPGNTDNEFPHQKEGDCHDSGKDKYIKDIGTYDRTAVLPADFIQDDLYVFWYFHVAEILYQHEDKPHH